MRVICFRCLLLTIPAFFLYLNTSVASHIVGGEFELEHREGFDYELRMILYFDEINANPGVKSNDQNVVVYIYSKRNDEFIRAISLPRVALDVPVNYTNPACAVGDLVTSKMLYARSLTLSPEVYDDPEGYYVVWERCCRNYTITNARSNVPVSAGGSGPYAGQTFYLEFPPVVKNGLPFVNSTPELFPPLSDYACKGLPFYFDFSGSDKDGDSIVYRLSEPINTSQGIAIPAPVPASRHEPVQWNAGYGLDNMIPGQPALNISEEGIIGVTPSQTGLFVFAVKAEEYRNGKKIGEVRRDFQMLVLDCEQSAAPEIGVRRRGGTSFQPTLTTVFFSEETPASERCLEVQITDQDFSSPLGESLSLRARLLDENQRYITDLPLSEKVFTNAKGPITTQVCFDQCPPTRSGRFYVDIIAFDDACAVPLQDTSRVPVQMPKISNRPPRLFINGQPGQAAVNGIVVTGDTLRYSIQGLDADGDSLSLNVNPNGFNLNDYNMEVNVLSNEPGNLEAELVWVPDCNEQDFSVFTSFLLALTLEDADPCGLPDSRRSTLSLGVDIPDFKSPELFFSGVSSSGRATVNLNDTLSFLVFGIDPDNGPIDLRVEDAGVDLNAIGASFTDTSSTSGQVQSSFTWVPNCDNISSFEANGAASYTVNFVAQDAGNCNAPDVAPGEVLIEVQPVPNQPPTVRVAELGQPNRLTMAVNTNEVLNILGEDNDPDSISLTLENIYNGEERVNPDELNIAFNNVKGLGNVVSPLTLTPTCEVLTSRNTDSANFRLVFRVEDKQCLNPENDTLSLAVNVVDEPVNFEQFRPDNAFTPNGDGFGDEFFLLPDSESDFRLSPEEYLPPGNCFNQFDNITIYNRWGGVVFRSRDPAFKWAGTNQPAGVYYYTLEYTLDNYKGAINLYLEE